MSAGVRGPAAWLAAALLSVAAWATVHAGGQSQPVDRPALTGEREKVSYMIGVDVGRSYASIAPDIDLEAFERAVRNVFADGKPLLTDAEADAVGAAMMQRIAERNGRPVPGLPPGARPPAAEKDKVGYLLGTGVGRSLAPIRDEIEMPVFMYAVRSTLASAPPLLDDAEMGRIREALSKRVDAREVERAADQGRRNAEAGAAFLARNKKEKGVISTASGLQYRVLRQGTGMRPRPTERVRVNYQGTLLDGTVFDSTYERGQHAEFALNQVIAGWTEGLSLMPVGAKYRFWIPAEIAYGERGKPPEIGPNATLVFDVELLDIL